MGVSASGGACETLTSADTQKGEAHRWPQILPGGKSVLFTISVQGEYDSARIAVLDLKRREYKVVANGGSAPRYVPSGHLVYVRGGAIFASSDYVQKPIDLQAFTDAVCGIVVKWAGRKESAVPS